MNVMAIASDPKQIFCFGSACGETDPNYGSGMPGDPLQNPGTRVQAGRTGFRLIVNDGTRPGESDRRHVEKQAALESDLEGR